MEENLSVSNAREIAGIDSGMGEIGNRQPLRGGVHRDAIGVAWPQGHGRPTGGPA